MKLSELADQLLGTSQDPAVKGLAWMMRQWRSSDATVEDLRKSVERYIGHTWIASDAEHERVYGLWSKFHDEAVQPIAGMTMNERLYHFDLYAEYDACRTDEERLRIYKKLLASP
jgi:hypothetical protein